MSRGKPLAVGPTARLAEGHDLGEAGRDDARRRSATQDVFPYPSLPHPASRRPGGQVFPQMQIEMFPRLERFDVDFDLPEAFLPEFPPAIFLQNRPELGDVSRGEVVSINNYYRLFKDILTPVQLDGLRLLLTPFPQEEFNPTDDRKSAEPSLGVTCFDCHVNGHTTGQFHLNPDIRPQQRRFRLDTVSLRGVFNQQIHGSKRSLRSVEDFTEFEQRTAYFNGDPIHAMKKGFEHPRPHPGHAHGPDAEHARLPARPEADRRWAGSTRRRRPRASCAARSCSSARRSAPPATRRPFYLDHQMHDLHAGAVPQGRARRRPDQDASRCAASRTARRTCTTAAA